MLTEFVCPICKARMARDMSIIKPHTETHIIDAIKKKHPKWAKADGVCRKCYDYYKSQIHQAKRQ